VIAARQGLEHKNEAPSRRPPWPRPGPSRRPARTG